MVETELELVVVAGPKTEAEEGVREEPKALRTRGVGVRKTAEEEPARRGEVVVVLNAP